MRAKSKQLKDRERQRNHDEEYRRAQDIAYRTLFCGCWVDRENGEKIHKDQTVADQAKELIVSELGYQPLVFEDLTVYPLGIVFNRPWR